MIADVVTHVLSERSRSAVGPIPQALKNCTIEIEHANTPGEGALARSWEKHDLVILCIGRDR